MKNPFSFQPNAIGASQATSKRAIPFHSLPATPFPGLGAMQHGQCMQNDAAPGPGTNPQLSPAIRRGKKSGCGCNCGGR